MLPLPLRFAPSRVTNALVAVCGLRVLVLQAGIDHQTTLQIWSNPICATIGIGAGAAFAWFLARNWFSPTSGKPVPAWIVKLRNDDSLSWRALGVVVTIGFSALAASICANLMGVAAQYLKGPQDSFTATVISERTIRSPRAVCRRELKLLRSSDVAELTFCLQAADRPSLARGALQPYMAVTVNVVDTKLGLVVVSVEPQ
jgi:hypothetical protein